MIVKITLQQDVTDKLLLSMNRGRIIELKEESKNNEETVFLEKAFIDRIKNLKVEIYSDEHPPPHFHVKTNDGDENSFRIDNAEPLYPNGGLKKWFKNIKKWHSENRYILIETWNEMRPTDCPVGPIKHQTN